MALQIKLSAQGKYASYAKEMQPLPFACRVLSTQRHASKESHRDLLTYLCSACRAGENHPVDAK